MLESKIMFTLFALGPFATALTLCFLYEGIRRKAISIQTISSILCSICGMLAYYLSSGKTPDFVRDMVFPSTVVLTIASWAIIRMVVMREHGDKLGARGALAAVATVVLQLAVASIW